MLDKEGLRKNKHLFFLSVCIFIQIVLIGTLLISYSKLYISFVELNASDSLKTNLSTVNWSFLNYIWKSGEAMSVYGNISRLRGYQDNQLIDFVDKFFSGETVIGPSLASSTQSSTTNSAEEISKVVNHFFTFNTHLQLSVAYISCLSLFSAVSISLFLFLFFKSIIISKPFNLYKLFLSSTLSIWGFFLAIYWENKLMERGDWETIEKESKLIKNLFITKAYTHWKNKRNNFIASSDSDDLIVVNNLYFAPPNNQGLMRLFRKKKETKYILKDINLRIKKGSFNVIIGPNGSGKTTLIKSLVNLYDLSKGEVLWNGMDVSKINKTTFSKHVSYIPQFLNIEHSISVIDFLSFSRYPYKDELGNNPQKDREKVIESLKTSDCESFTEKMIDELSGGQRQKILLTSVLSQESSTIVLDEPTSFLDIKNQHNFLETLRKFNSQGKTIIMILHDIQQAINYANNLIVVKDGRIKASGHPLEVVTEDLLRDTFKINCSLLRTSDSLELSNISSAQQ